jgi:hypothetical protein
MDDQKYLSRIMKNRQKIVDAVENENLKTVKEISEHTGIGLRATRSILQALYPNIVKPSTKPHIFYTFNMGTSLSDNLHIGIHSFAKKLRRQLKDENLHIPSISTIANKTRAAISDFLEADDKPDIPIIDTGGDYNIILVDVIDQDSDEYKKLYSEHQRQKITK